MPRRKKKKDMLIDILLPAIFGLGVGALLLGFAYVIITILGILGGLK